MVCLGCCEVSLRKGKDFNTEFAEGIEDTKHSMRQF
jgi:hypothetical protein